MRQVMRKGLITMAAATGVFAATGGYAQAQSGPGSPGLLSGNSVQVPVHVPVNVCGNTVDVLGVGNSASGNRCGDSGPSAGGGHGSSGHGSHGSSGSTGHGSSGSGGSGDSPGVGSGNHVEVPVTVPVNVCGNTVSVIGLGNPAAGNTCGTGGHGTPPPSPKPPAPKPPSQPPAPQPPSPRPPARPVTPVGHEPRHPQGPGATQQLAETGSALPLGVTLTLGGGAVLAGAVLYRKARAA